MEEFGIGKRPFTTLAALGIFLAISLAAPSVGTTAVIPVQRGVVTTAKVKPKTIMVGALSRAEKIRWRSWGGRKATGRARYAACSILTSRCKRMSVRLKASGKRYCPVNGRKTYMRLKIVPVRRNKKSRRAGLPINIGWKHLCFTHHGPLMP